MSSASGALPYYKLVTPTTTVTLAAAQTDANTTFNTNVPFGKAINIRRLRWIAALETGPETTSIISQFLWELTEDTTKTAVAQKDPFSLDDGGLEYTSALVTGAGFISTRQQFPTQVSDFIPPHPGVPSVAQQLNVVVSGLRIVGAGTEKVGVFAELFYELIDLSENLRTFLSNRIVLQRTT